MHPFLTKHILCGVGSRVRVVLDVWMFFVVVIVIQQRCAFVRDRARGLLYDIWYLNINKFRRLMFVVPVSM